MVTKRLCHARIKAITKWKKGLQKDNLSEPNNHEILVFETAFNMGYKQGRKHALNPKDSRKIKVKRFHTSSLLINKGE